MSKLSYVPVSSSDFMAKEINKRYNILMRRHSITSNTVVEFNNFIDQIADSFKKDSQDFNKKSFVTKCKAKMNKAALPSYHGHN